MSASLVSQWVRYAADTRGDTTLAVSTRMIAANEIEKYAPQQPVPADKKSLVSQWLAYAAHQTGDRTSDLTRGMIASREISVMLGIG